MMKVRIPALFCLLGAAAALPLHAVEPPCIVTYPYPYLTSEDRTVTVRYGSDGTSVLETHESSDTPGIAPANDDSPYLPGERIAGPMTGFRSGRIQHWDDEIGTNFIEVTTSPQLKEHVRYVDNRLKKAEHHPDQSSWSISGFSVDLSEGSRSRPILDLETDHWTVRLSFTRTEYDPDGTETGKETERVAFDVWTSKDLPFSPLPLAFEPLAGRRVPPYLPGPLENRFLFQLAESLRPHGGLVRAETTVEGETYAMQITGVRKAPELPLEKFTPLPVIDSSRVNRFAGPLFLTSLLRDGMVRTEADGTLQIDGRDLPAASSWKENAEGDLVVVISAPQEETTLFLVRPLSGTVQPDVYDVTPAPDPAELRELSQAELETHSQAFRLYGLIDTGPLPAVVTGFDQGEVTIRSNQNGRISGTVEGTVSVLPTTEVSDPEIRPLSFSFDAQEGLDSFRFRSTESRFSNR
jgi:hypothetical protein